MDYSVRKLHRLKEYDYSQNGYYFITVCTKDRLPILGDVKNTSRGDVVVEPSLIGKVVLEAWEGISALDLTISTDCFCLMPNHIHGIVVIDNTKEKNDTAERRGRRSLHDIVKGFKSCSTREYNRIVSADKRNQLWQASFYDTVIRNEAVLYEVRKYIEENPAAWAYDKYFSESERALDNFLI